MIDPWLQILKRLPLSKTEKEVLKRYQDDPQGRVFLPIADILRSHRYVDESIELLTQGLSRHATFTVARVVLARELFQKGLVIQSWRTLEESPTPLLENALAQRLRFKLAVLLTDESNATATLTVLRRNQLVDIEIKRYAEIFEIQGILSAKETIKRDLKQIGIEITLPDLPKETKKTEEPVKPISTRDFFDKNFLDPVYESLSGFHVVPLREVFTPTTSTYRDSGMTTESLDSSTLAEIYIKQSHYKKALEIYRRLLRQSPGNDMIRTKVIELQRLAKEEQESELTQDPHLYDKMESVDLINKQMKFLDALLQKMN